MKTLLSLTYFLFFILNSSAQNVTITPTGITPATSFSYPRISYNDIIALPSPQKGDLAYDLSNDCLRLYNGSKWLKLLTETIASPTASAVSFNSNVSSGAGSVKKDASGNIYVLGSYKGTLTIGGSTITAINDNDVYLAKFNNSGLLIWLRTGGGNAGDVATDLTIDPSGNPIITGYFFDAITFGSITLPYTGGSDIFLTKYDSNGGVIWAKKAGDNGLDISSAVETDGSGNIYITGYFLGSPVFYGTTNITLVNAGGEDSFLAKFDASGNVSWVQSISGSTNERGNDIAISGSNIYVTGQYGGTTNFGNSVSLTNSTLNIFIAKYNLLGVCSTATSIGGTSVANAYSLKIDNSSNILIGGLIYGNAIVGSFSLISTGYTDAFFAKLDQNFNVLNAKLFGSNLYDQINDIYSDSSGFIYITGSYFNTMTVDSKTITSNDANDVFVAKLDNSGQVIWLESFGGSSYDSGSSIVYNGSVFVVGGYSNTVNFGSTVLTNTTGFPRGFFLKLVE